ncbi:MAG: hypothetical protein ACTSRU_21065 [Candidatus Hodarchaeales archaeon]
METRQEIWFNLNMRDQVVVSAHEQGRIKLFTYDNPLNFNISMPAVRASMMAKEILDKLGEVYYGDGI